MEGTKVAMFLKLTFLESKARRELFERYPPKVVYVSSSRLQCAKNGDFEVSSMYGYLPNKDMSPIHLSYDQAERMRDFYRYVCGKRKPVKSIDVILLTSSGLGLGKYDKPEENETSNYEARRNLKVLSNTFDEDEFDVSAYKSMITPFRENKII